MTLKIFTNLNLNQSLSDFQVNITELLKLNNVTEWSGKTLKEREEKIREAALILAGQCVAILLDKLSKSREASRTAINQIQGWWRTKTRKNGCKIWQILTVGNVIVKLIADAAFNDAQERKNWFLAARSDLKKGKILSLIEQMKQDRKSVRGSRREILTVESLIRQAVNLRLKGNGKFWLQHNAEIILHARCHWLSGNWNNFSDSILTSRIYPAFC